MRSYQWRSQAACAGALAVRDAAFHHSAITTSPRPARAGLRATLLASVWAGALGMSAPATAQVSGTWTAPLPNPQEWTQGTNWSSNPDVPDTTATFTNNSAATSVTISSTTSIGTIQFTSGAPAYSFAVNLALFEINGLGIVNDSAFAPSFTNNGATTFTNSSSAGNASITNNGGFTLSFTDTSTAGSATITTNNGALTQFATNSTGGNARFITNAGGTVDFSGTSGPSGNNQITAGSIEGAGTYFLGSNQLTVGSNNLSSAVSGDIQDGGTFGGSGASLVKTGTGTLTLSGNNSYTGATTISAGTLVAASDTALPGQTALAVNLGATLRIGNGVNAQIGSLADGASGGGSVVIGPSDNTTLLTIAGNGSTTFSGAFSGAGSLELDGGSLTLTGASNGGNIGTIGGDLSLCNCDNGGLTISGGSLTVNGFAQGVTVESGTLAVINGGKLQVGDTPAANDLLVASNMIISGAGSSVTVNGFTGIGIFGPATLSISSGGVLNSQSGAEIDSILGTPTATVTGPGSTWNVGGFGLSVGGGSIGNPGKLTISNGGAVNTNVTFIGDSADGSSTVLVTGAGSRLTATTGLSIGGEDCGCGPLVGTLAIADGGVVEAADTRILANSTLRLGIGGLGGTLITPTLRNDGSIVANFTDTITLAARISGSGTLSKAGTGTLILTGNSSYSGATTVNAGTLVVNGSIANSAVTVNSGATLGGTGIVGTTTINSGGIFAPGTAGTPAAMTVQGNLAFQSGALYLVRVTPSNASSDKVTSGGTATLAGTVQAAFASGTYATRAYTILSAAGGLGGTTFNSLTTTNLPAGFAASLSYTNSEVILNLTAQLHTNAISANGLSANQKNVATALDNFFNSGGTLPPGFVSVFGLTGSNLGNALSQLSGEAATAGQQGAFQMGNQFLGIMLDPFVDGRNGAAGGGGPAIAFAPEREPVPDEIALAYAAVLKAPAVPAPTFEQRWSAWGSAYGGSNRTSGDPAVIGSHDLSARTAGFAGGLDYRLTPNTIVGVALAGGGTNWSLAQGLGGGKSDAFQAGVYGVTRSGPAYLAAAFAFANHWMSTDRFAFAGDHLTASFNAQSLGARVESGYRFATAFGGLAPYAAIQAQSFRTPTYSETDLNGGGFALGYAGRTATDTRSELGARFDRLLALNPNAALALRARLAWAHDWVSDPTLAPVFQALPGASFIVNGAAPVKNSALVSGGTELRLANGVSLLGKFDGEFASRSSTYAGTGMVRYAW
jgi:autotransporter-associated beta strand protein/T5SS/PEP-CTERM-associated repeat protein